MKQMEKSTKIKTLYKWEWKGPKDHSVQTLGSTMSLRAVPGIPCWMHKLIIWPTAPGQQAGWGLHSLTHISLLRSWDPEGHPHSDSNNLSNGG